MFHSKARIKAFGAVLKHSRHLFISFTLDWASAGVRTAGLREPLRGLNYACPSRTLPSNTPSAVCVAAGREAQPARNVSPARGSRTRSPTHRHAGRRQGVPSGNTPLRRTDREMGIWHLLENLEHSLVVPAPKPSEETNYE